MPELASVQVSVVLCAATPEALDRLVPPGHGARAIRTAPDELLFVGPPDVGRDVLREVEDRVVALDTDALALEVTDGWASWVLRGPDARDALRRVSLLEPPLEGWIQGDVAGLPTKVLADPEELLLLVPASTEEHLRARLAPSVTEVPS